jgi:hypothetical protein
MALNTYAGMQDAIARWLRRTDLTSAIPDFISLAETRFNRELRLRAMETVVSGTLSTATLSVPSDMIELERLVLYPTNREVELEYFPPKNMQKYAGMSALPFAFTTINQQIYVGPAPDSAYAYSLFYIAKIPPLSASLTTNFLLTAAPDVYLYASLLEAAPYLKEDGRIALWEQAYNNSIAKVQHQDDQQQYPQGSLVIRSDMRL